MIHLFYISPTVYELRISTLEEYSLAATHRYSKTTGTKIVAAQKMTHYMILAWQVSHTADWVALKLIPKL